MQPQPASPKVRPRPFPPSPSPSGLFPAGRRPPARPTYREPHPVTGAGVAAGIAVAFAWLLLFGLIGRSLAGYVWWTLLAGALAWLVALALLRYGDRGVGAGVALATSLGWSVAVVALALRWLADGDWPLW